MRNHLALTAAIFLALGICDLALASRVSEGLSPVVSAFPVVAAVWLACALLFAAVVATVGRLAAGRSWPVTATAQARDLVAAWFRERGTPDDRRRAARLIVASLLCGASIVVAVMLIAKFVAPRNAPMLVAAVSVGITVVSVAGGLSLFAAIDRRLLDHLDFTWRIPGLGVLGVVASLAVGTVILVAGTIWGMGDLFSAVEGPALLLFAGASALGLAALGGVRHRTPTLLYAVLGLVSVGGLLLLNPLRDGRSVVSRTPFARHVVAALGAASDFDDDGAPAFPLLRDCAPFDETRHPLAGEIDGNGIDENCDGEDEIRAFRLPDRKHRQWTTVPPNIVFVTFDATRADHTGFMGYGRDTTPNLDALAARGVVFEAAFSQDSGTGPSFWSLFAGKTPFQVDLYNGHRFPPYIAKDEKLLGEFLKDAGYENYAVLCGTLFDRDYWTIRNGFKYWKNVCGKRRNHTAPIVNKAALSVVGKLPAKKPFFLWVHYFDPHHGYSKHDAPFGTEPIDRYDAEIRYADEHFAKLWSAIEKRQLQRPTYLFFSADHGEAFGEHGDSHHARTLYREVTHVPLLAVGPGIQPRRVETPVALNDLFPTFLELARAEVPTESTMVSLAPFLFQDEPLDPDRPIFQENSYSRPRRHAKAIVRGPYHLIRDVTNDTDELFDYRADPLEENNLVDERPEVHRALRQELDAFISTTTIPKGLR